ncbi:hypothetical protein HanXRQr2_Chr08g0357311 [Helianthus annuus]|uniref:Uncharacterized protein n=1 Tax=Helianthus annuus TaxID=4232 RepID=A0A9K3IHZ9_HELAN|nr:hypothetical protein HanXRQr2_Chr08g0357311 [Helianthus annuus]
MISLKSVLVIPLQTLTCDFASKPTYDSALTIMLFRFKLLHVISLGMLLHFMCFRLKVGSNVIFDPLHNSCCDFDEEKNTKLSEFSSILEFMRRVPIQKAMTDQHLVYKSHVKRFWKHATYDEANKVIHSVVKQHNEKKTIVVTEALVHEVLNFSDDANSPTKFPERMALSQCKGGYDAMRDYQMNMVTALVLNKKYKFSHIIFHYMAENITTKSRTWIYPRFVQMLIGHAYSDIERDVNNDLLVLSHMSNDSLKQLARYHPNHPEPTKVAEFFGFIKDANYVDPDPVNHQNWRNEEEMKEAAYADELEALEKIKSTRNDWFVKEPRKRGKKATPKVQKGEGSSSQPKKRQKKVAKTMLIDEPDVEEHDVEAEAETEAEANIEVDVRLSPNSQSLLKKLKLFNTQKKKQLKLLRKKKLLMV